MSDPSRPGFEVAPARIGASAEAGPRRRRLPIVIVLLLAVGIPAVSVIGPRIENRLDFRFLLPGPSPVPSPTPRPTLQGTLPRATPLPAITFGDGPRPAEPLAVDVGGIRLIDPATGSLGPPIDLRGDEDAIFAGPGGGWWCVCFERIGGSQSEAATVELRRVRGDGREISRRVLGEYESGASSPNADWYTRFDLELSADRRTGYLASGVRSADRWTVALEALDLVHGRLIGRSGLATFDVPPSPSPTGSPDPAAVETYLAGPSIRISPDGRRLVAWAWIESYSPVTGEGTGEPRAWLLDLATDAATGGPVATTTPLTDDLAADLRECGWVAWVAADELAAICAGGDSSSGQARLVVRRFGVDGGERGEVGIDISEDWWFGEPLLDTANGLIYVWEPTAHVMHRIDFRRDRATRIEADREVPQIGLGGGGPVAEARPTWVRPTSALRLYHTPPLVAEPTGSRIFALGVVRPILEDSRGVFGSSGIWVFESRDFILADHWPAVAAYTSIGISRDGRWLTAIGAAGADAAGRPADWDYSLSVIDVVDGRGAMRIGSLADENGMVLQVPPDPNSRRSDDKRCRCSVTLSDHLLSDSVSGWRLGAFGPGRLQGWSGRGG